MEINDADARIQATDPTRSFIVQAPAGSGKTEILTQRYLRLLAKVEAPEEIIALTFTKKAAYEMQARIMRALSQAHKKIPPVSEHEKKTYQYATEALQHHAKLNSQLLSMPDKFKIMTIDALCQLLSHAIPIHEQNLPYANITSNPELYYENAATECLVYLLESASYCGEIKCLLKHLDNRADVLVKLFSQLLASRDQWLEPLMLAKNQLQGYFEQALVLIEQQEIERFAQLLPPLVFSQLCRLYSQLANITGRLNLDPADKPREDGFTREEGFTPEVAFTRKVAQSIANVFLTSTDSLRKSFDHHVGLTRNNCEANVYNSLKKESRELCETLEAYPDFIDQLIRIKTLPIPKYTDQQWNVLQAIFKILPLLTAHLYIQFQQHNEIDFIAVTKQAIDALGEEDNPTDLTLHLDYSLSHLLIDEFQDTSLEHFRLITRLVHGWDSLNQKTLFIVGDPMQSIYRFRAAEVGLFLQAKNHGIGSVKLVPLILCTNFRSSSQIVNWTNKNFDALLPKQANVSLGAIPYHKANAALPSSPNSYIKAQAYQNPLDQAHGIVNIIKHELELYPSGNIALLVRSRNQLKYIIPLLNQYDISYQGVDINLLADLAIIQDAWTLTQVLLTPDCRTAWLSFLRSPWCGLSLTDLFYLADFEPKKSILYALQNLDQIEGLTRDGHLRCQFILQVMEFAILKRSQKCLSAWIINTLKELNINYILTNTERQILEQFWDLLDQYEQEAQLINTEFFIKKLQQLYSKQSNTSRLQIMTIHKSKGLEFDCVILPSLSQKAAPQDKPLIRWMQLPTGKNENIHIISPIKSMDEVESSHYQYIGSIFEQKETYEQQRLLYVATTRAKSRLYLIDHCEKPVKGSFRDSLSLQTFETMPVLELQNSLDNLPLLKRLPISFYQLNNRQIFTPPNPVPVYSDPTTRYQGIVTHEILQWIGTFHPNTAEEIPYDLARDRLRQFGFSESKINSLIHTITTYIEAVLKDDIGKWILKPHKEEQNEYELLIQNANGIKTKIIDRTFLSDGNRWIIDYKTGVYDPISHLNYQEQLNEYAKYLTELHSESIYCGIFYVGTCDWYYWLSVQKIKEMIQI